MKSPADLFKGYVEYPPMARLWEMGLESDILYTYVSSTYLNAILPYIARIQPVTEREGKARKVWLLQRYRNAHSPARNTPPLTNEEIVQKVMELERSAHSKLTVFDDDLILVCETENSWWYLYLDCDVSDCAIGQISKAAHTLEEISTVIEEWFAEDKGRPNGFIRAELPISILRGWVQF